MTAEIPDALPNQLIAGDTWQWTRSYGDYPADTWQATIYFEGESKISSVATASGSDYSFNINAETTSDKKPGRYKWWVRVTDGTVYATVEEGWIDIKPNPATPGQRDLRSFARRALDAIEATLENRATSDQLSMAINGRTLSRIPIPDLITLRNQLRQEVRTQEKGASAGLGRYIRVRLPRV